MRRKDRKISDPKAIEAILQRGMLCYLALADQDQPYLVPVNYGYADNTLYFHSAKKGKKIDMIRKNPRICFLVKVDEKLLRSEKAAEWTMRYQSVIGYGKASLIEDPEAMKPAYDILMKQYTDEKFAYPDGCLKASLIIKVEIEELSGKANMP